MFRVRKRWGTEEPGSWGRFVKLRKVGMKSMIFSYFLNNLTVFVELFKYKFVRNILEVNIKQFMAKCHEWVLKLPQSVPISVRKVPESTFSSEESLNVFRTLYLVQMDDENLAKQVSNAQKDINLPGFLFLKEWIFLLILTSLTWLI